MNGSLHISSPSKKPYRQLFDILTVFLMMCMTMSAQEQSNTSKRSGLPFITNYPKSVYNASTQNWSVGQNPKGFVYFGNNDGLMEFDGQHWQTYPIPNGSIIRSILVVNDTVYIGAFEECGYFAPGQDGKMTYHSLIPLIPHEYRAFDEIWKIHRIQGAILFQSFRFLLQFKGEKLDVLVPPSQFSHSYSLGDSMYVIDRKAGLLLFENNQLEPVINNQVFAQHEIRCLLRLNRKQVLLGTINDGVYVFDGKELLPWNSPVNKVLRENGLFSAIRLSNGNFAFGSVQNGLYISDENGTIVQQINRIRGLQNNTILSLFEDRQHNLWLGLDNGIDFIEISSPLSVFNYNFNLESTYTTLVSKGFWYVGTNQGLYVAKRQDATSGGSFHIIQGTEGQVWFLKEINGQVFCGHNFGCFLIEDEKAVKLSDERGFWTIIPCRFKPGVYIAGLYDGLGVITHLNNKWKFERKIEGFNVSSKTVLQDENGTFWISHGYRGLYSLKTDPDLQKATEVRYYNGNNGLPVRLPYAIHQLNDRLVFSTWEGFFTYDTESNQFSSSEKLNKIFQDKYVYETIEQDRQGNIWYFTQDFMGVKRLQEDGNYSDITAPFLKISKLLIPAFKSVFVLDDHHVFIGSQIGLIHYDPFVKKNYQLSDPVYFREISFSKGADSVARADQLAVNPYAKHPNIDPIPYPFNTVTFRYASPGFESGHRDLFAYRLKGFDSGWSSWETGTFKEYTNLPQGKYTFEIKALNSNQKESAINSFSFTIEPPFFRSKIAYVVYFFLFLMFILVNFMVMKRRIRMTRIRENLRHDKEMQEQEHLFREKSLLAEREIIGLRNETLKGEVNYKNKELANTTQHLIHKNKILHSIKHQLVELSKQLIDQNQKAAIDYVIRRINKDLKNEKFQDVFDSYFDDVHQDFIDRLKKKHANLSPKELRLCAYLKMNLSSKQIAPLLNISVRGVEIGRYRLRKKLEIEREDNLIEYLLSI